MEYPKIYLALDNCFALKRWVEPETWLPLIKDLGYTSIQASYDNEFDMLYNTKEYIDSWLERLTVAEKQYGAKVQSFYSGYQTYRTSGLAHPDRRVVNSIVEGWIKPAVKIAGERNVDMGFALHGIPKISCRTRKNIENVMKNCIVFILTSGNMPERTDRFMSAWKRCILHTIRHGQLKARRNF